MPKTRTICFALCFATLTQIISACKGSGDAVDNIQTPADTTSGQENPAPQASTFSGGMLDTGSAGVQRMQSLRYVAEAKVSFGATSEVYSTTGKYRMQSLPPVLSSGR